MITELLLIVSINGVYLYQQNNSEGRPYLVEANRLLKEIEEQKTEVSEIELLNLNKYETIVGISEFAPGEVCANDYLVEEIDGKLYRIEYKKEKNLILPLYINITLLSMMIATIIVLMYVYYNPFRSRRKEQKNVFKHIKKRLKTKEGNEYDSSGIYYSCHHVCIIKCK